MRSLLTRNEVKGQQKIRNAEFADTERGKRSAKDKKCGVC